MLKVRSIRISQSVFPKTWAVQLLIETNRSVLENKRAENIMNERLQCVNCRPCKNRRFSGYRGAIWFFDHPFKIDKESSQQSSFRVFRRTT